MGLTKLMVFFLYQQCLKKNDPKHESKRFIGGRPCSPILVKGREQIAT